VTSDGARMRRERALGGAAVAAVLLGVIPANAFVLAEDELEDTSTEFGVIGRSFGFVLAGDTLTPPLAPEDASPSAINVEDLRSYLSYRSSHLRLVWHQETRSIVRSHGSLGAFDIGRGAGPPRWLPLRATFADDPTLRLETEADWAYAAYAAGPATVTVGRQPVTFGRGRLFRPWDVVARFSLTEVDTEYKPGADAVRVALSPASETTIDAVAVAGETVSDHDVEMTARGSALALTFRQGWSGGEFSGLAALVRGDLVFGYGALFTFNAFDLYGEATLTRTGGSSLPVPAAVGRRVPITRGLLGASFKPSSDLTLIPELYYDGFGARRSAGYLGVLASERVTLGEQVTLGRFYAGAALDWEAHPLLHATFLGLSNPLDPSALLSLALTYEAAENTRLVAGAYIPVGAGPDATFAAGSEFGLYPNLGFVEVRVAL